MRKLMAFPLALILAPAVLGWGQKPKRPVAAALSLPTAAASTVNSLAVSPLSISFGATDPDTAPSVAGSSSATVSFGLSGGSNGATWTLAVQAAGSSFTGCATVPASAVTVTCSSATASNNPQPVCGAAFTLSTSPQQVVSGKEKTGNPSYSVVINYTLADSWKYVASSSCSLDLTYTLTAP